MLPPLRPLKSLTMEEYNSIPDDYLSLKKCIQCGMNYKECENIGRLRCRIHTGTIEYDPHRNTSLYNCCQRPYDSSGCTKGDHMEGELPNEDLGDRRSIMEEWAILILPSIYLQYGIDCPLSSTILYNSSYDRGEKELSYELPFGRGLVELEKVKRSMKNIVTKSPFLSVVYSKKGGNNGREELDMGWRNTLNDEDGLEGEDDEEEGVVKNIPFLIIQRIKK